MFRSRLSLVLATLCCLIAGPVLAQDVDAEDRAAIRVRIDQLGRAISGGEMARTLDVVPPRLLEATAARFGATVAQLRQAFTASASQIMGGATIVSYTMDLEGASTHRTPTGDRTYLLIPTETVMDVPGAGRSRTISQTLAIAEEGDWYLIRISDAPQRAILVETYPEFSGVAVPEGRIEAVPSR